MSDTQPTDWDSVFSALAHEDRRETLQFLAAQQGEVAVADLVEHVSGEAADADAVAQKHVLLHHVHLPKLAAADLVVWNTEDGTVAETALTYQVPFGAIVSPAEPVDWQLATRQPSD
jgi:hypothetical protein